MPAQPSRCRFQFRLRTLLIVVTALCLPLSYVGWQARIVRERRETLDWIGLTLKGTYDQFSDEYDWDESNVQFRPPLIRRLLGDHAYFRAEVPRQLSNAEAEKIREAFPGIEIVVGKTVEERLNEYRSATKP